MLRKAPPCGPVSSAAREKSWVGGGLVSVGARTHSHGCGRAITLSRNPPHEPNLRGCGEGQLVRADVALHVEAGRRGVRWEERSSSRRATAQRAQQLGLVGERALPPHVGAGEQHHVHALRRRRR